MNSLSVLIATFFFTSFLFEITHSVENKYSKEANSKNNGDKIDSGDSNKKFNYRELDKPFRMAKLNLVWHKALQKLSETKLASLYTDLQLHDKEELKLKRLISDGQDKEGLLEAGVRKKFRAILNSFSLLEYFEEGSVSDKQPQEHSDSDNHINKSLFKDKKLNKLWEKAERGGFDEMELKALKEEFVHHQDKLDEYYYLMESLTNEEKNLMQNDIPDINTEAFDEDEPPGKKYESKYNHIKEKQRQLKDGIDKLHKKTASGPTSTDFTEPRVQTLWRLALAGRFTPEELDSMKTELKHFEKRLQKLQHLQSEYLVKKDHGGYEENDKHGHTDKDMNSIFEDKIKRHERTVEKMHTTLEEKIMNRHTEL